MSDAVYPPTRFQILSDAPDRDFPRGRKKSLREEAAGYQAAGAGRDCPPPGSASAAIRRGRRRRSSAASSGPGGAGKPEAGRSRRPSECDQRGSCADHRPGSDPDAATGSPSPVARRRWSIPPAIPSRFFPAHGRASGARRDEDPAPSRGAGQVWRQEEAEYREHEAPACAAAPGRGYRRGGGNP